MSVFSVEVIEHVPVCGDVVSVRFSRPAGFSFTPGQYLTLALDTDDGVERKPFTISSGAHQPLLEITTRISGSAFKRALTQAAPGVSVRIGGPAGRLRLPGGVPRVAFLVGGVGITPVASMVRTWRATDGHRPEVVVFFGNHDANCMPLADEIAPRAGEPLSVVHVLEHAAPGWRGERGFITSAMVRARLGGAGDWNYVVAGPPPMIGAMEAVLRELGVNRGDVLIERFGPAVTSAPR